MVKMKLFMCPENDDIKNLYAECASKFHDGDCGIDLFCVEDKVIAPMQRSVRIELGIRCKATRNDVPSGYFLIPRSSISKTPLRLANSIGLIDAGYRGVLISMVDNISNEEFVIKKGQRLFQICSPNLNDITVELVDKLDSTTRGNGGFGSTG